MSSPAARLGDGSASTGTDCSEEITGKYILKVVPIPCSEYTQMYASACFTRPYTVASPSPVPCPTALVVKNGSKTRLSVSRLIPCPVSLTATCTYRPALTLTPGFVRVYSRVKVTSAVSIVSVPP
jgi:hypothetical protein